ncbi:MAG: hypothetical protein ACR2PH_12865 [Desulfobulbia bacterium]
MFPPKKILVLLYTTLSINLIWILAVNAQQVQEQQEGVINYAYSNWIGTGYYRIEDRTIWIFRFPFQSYTLRKPEGNKWGTEILFPLTLGLDQFDFNNLNIGSFTFVPGIRFSYQVYDNWQLKPYGQIGVGKEFKGGDWNTIWGCGIESLVLFPFKYGELQLGNSLRFADHSQSGNEGDNGFSMFEIGLNYKRPVNLNLFSRQNNLNLFTIYKEFINDLEFFNAFNNTTRINRLFTFGIVLSFEPSIRILGFPIKGAGLTYTHGNGFTGIGLTTGFPF